MAEAGAPPHAPHHGRSQRPARRTRQPGELPFAVLFLAFTLWLYIHLGTEARWIARLTWFQQPALWPAIAIHGMLAFGVVNLFASLLAQGSEGDRRELLTWLRALEYVGWYLAYAWAVGQIGYLPATLATMLLLVWRLGIATRVSLFWAAAFSVAVVVVFKSLLRVGIPGGRLYALFPPDWQRFLSVYF
ncbi:MAG: tripartite tricarboxylate transporter TctB family protein [Pararhodobacter sp.]|nr:tripartite tricarboxylate transporter TctB family protein [Pararhodobacter sp.]